MVMYEIVGQHANFYTDNQYFMKEVSIEELCEFAIINGMFEEAE